MTEKQFKEGVAYAEDNFLNDQAPHLKVDKALIWEKFDLNGKIIMDFGCGMGGMSLWYATNFDCHVHGVDIDGHHIEIAKSIQQKHKVENILFEKRDITQSPTTEKYDFIVLNDVAEHIRFDILLSILKVLNKSLSPSGKILVTYPPWRSAYASHVTHVVKILWCQYLPDKILHRLIEKNNQTLVGEMESDLLAAYKGLNKLTHKKLLALSEKAGLAPTFRKSHSLINRLPALKNFSFYVFPLDFLITKEFLLLEKSNTNKTAQTQTLKNTKTAVP
ncbi:MAG: class I SAM-dependent methyltransferase [Bacteroidetes bacterium]|nr:class I SAM-dependent methyltransferase [Bacteroidota bacterium]